MLVRLELARVALVLSMASTRNSPSLSPRKTVLPLMRADGRAGWKKMAWSFSGAGLTTMASIAALLVEESVGAPARSLTGARALFCPDDLARMVVRGRAAA